jgi:putative hydrolase
MSSIGPFGSEGPFGDLMRNLARMLTTQGPVNWEFARQLAVWGATGGQDEGNVDPLARVRLEELVRVAEMHVAQATGLPLSSGGVLTAATVTRSQWALRSLDAWQPLLERLATSLAAASIEAPDEADASDPMSQLLGNLPQVLGPLLFGMQAGSMVGQLASRALGGYDLPMPRPPADELILVPAAIDAFAQEWSLDPDDVRLWVCLREAANHAVLSRPHVRARLDELIGDYVGAWKPDPSVIEEKLAGFNPTDPSSLESTFGDPGALLGEMQTDDQRRLQVPLQALLCAVTGYVDHVMDTVGRRLIGSYGPLTEALRRRRLEDDPGTRILGQLFGVALDEHGYQRGQAFVNGVLERAGEDGLARLWASAHELPTTAEIDAPGLWLARIDLPLIDDPSDESDPPDPPDPSDGAPQG